ncbi:hypothetical protein [Microcoleus sp. A003_D6]|uniref:hypothetical protein n=1 Tax=Microcoleus sp. A003_D6 TaxID=3055266 RepID=UPI002FCF1637
MGDRAAFIFYPLALLYKIYPDVHWLLLVQAVALAFEYILLNLRHPWHDTADTAVSVADRRVKKSPLFQISYQQDDVFLFEKIRN